MKWDSLLSDLPFAPEHSAVRIRAILIHFGLKKKDFAEIAGIAPPNVTQLIKGEYAPSPAIAWRVKRALGIPGEWTLFDDWDSINEVSLRLSLLRAVAQARVEFEESRK